MPKLIWDWGLEVRESRRHAHVTKSLTGFVVGHENDKILTSPIAMVEGLIVTTRSGSVYQLGDISAEYLAEIAADGMPFDPENPIESRIQVTS